MAMSNFDMKDICDAYTRMTQPINFMDMDLYEDEEEEHGWWNPYATYDPDND